MHKFFVAFLLAPALAACAIAVPHAGPGGGTAHMSRAELAAYSRSVFERHNRVVAMLMERIDEIDTAGAGMIERLERAEADMLEACETLNRAAAARRDDRPLPPGLRREIPRTIGVCDRATREVERLLDEVAGAG